MAYISYLPKVPQAQQWVNVLRTYTDEQLLQITKREYSPRELWVEIAAELIIMDRYFKSKEGQLYYGNITNGFKAITPRGTPATATSIPYEKFVGNLVSQNDYQLMTLREVDRELYNRVSSQLPRTYFLINPTLKEYISFAGHPTQNIQRILPLLKNYWSTGEPGRETTGDVKLVYRPQNYAHRFYKNITAKAMDALPRLRTGTSIPVEEEETAITVVDDDADEILTFNDPTDRYLAEISENQNEEQHAEYLMEQQRRQEANRIQNEIKQRVLAKYPMLAKYKKSTVLYLYVDSDFVLFTGEMFNQPGLQHDKRTKVIWPSRLLKDMSNPSVEEMPFFEILVDVIEYVSRQ